ncbi:MAG: GDP-mannose 4,6-dehydratase [Candidatus Hermodarchaeota archaeon]
MNENKSILITGADGFLGAHLTEYCLNKGFYVVALKKPTGSLQNLSPYTNNKKKFSLEDFLNYKDKKIEIPNSNENLKILECDLKNTNLLEIIIEDVEPKYLFHFGAQPYVIPSWNDPVNTIETNVIGTINIFEPIKKNKIKTKVIVACSSAEYGTTTSLNKPLKEEDPLLAIHPYGISKVATELLARQYFINFGIETVILRFFNQTGPRKVNDACSDFVRKTAQIELGLVNPVIEVGNLSPYRDITGIKDSLEAIWLAAIKGRSGETYNVCSSKKIQIRELLKMVLELSNKKIKIKENTPSKLRKTDEDIILGDNTKIRNELGFKITQSIDEIIKDMFEYWIEYFKNRN